jgi:hypothetical protein
MSNGIREQKGVCNDRIKLVPNSKTPETGDWLKGRTDGRIKEIRNENPCAHCYYKSFVLGMMGTDV